MEIVSYLIAHTDPVVTMGILFVVDRFRRLSADLRQHMADEKYWREEHENWRLAHVTGHAPDSSTNRGK